MRALARLLAEADGRGGTRLAVLHSESPLLLRRTGVAGRGAGVTVHLVGGAAGPLRGDDLSLEITVGAGADLSVRSVAAQLALPGRAGLPPSLLTLRATVAAGGVLRWLPEPLIAAAGCDHRTVTHVEVAAGGTLLWRDDLVCGRHEEAPGDVRTNTTILYGGRTVYRHELAVGPHAVGWDGPAVLGGARAAGTLIALPADILPPGTTPTPGATPPGTTPTPGATPPGTTPTPGATPAGAAPTPGAAAAAMPLAGGGVLVAVLGLDIRQVRAVLDPLCVTAESRAPAGQGSAILR